MTHLSSNFSNFSGFHLAPNETSEAQLEKVFSSKPFNDLNKYNITKKEVQKFVEFMQEYHTNLTQLHSKKLHDDECQNYCQGELYQYLKEYNVGVHGYITLLICIFGTIANILNIMVLTKKDMAKAPINKILKWLAVADMFVMIEYIPFTSYQYIYRKSDDQDLSYAWAVFILIHMHFTQILHTISIGLTVTLAIWRYVAIRHPNGGCATFLLSHCNEAIIFPFIISPILCFPTYFVFKVQKVYVTNSIEPNYRVDADRNTRLYRFNFWTHAVIIKLLPCLILTVISCILVRVLCEASKRRLKLKDYNHPSANGHETKSKRPPRCDRRNDRTTTLLVAVLVLFLITELPQGLLGLMSAGLEKCFFSSCYTPFAELMDLLALINAAIGFVLYGLMSKQFRTTFKSLFFKRHFGSIEMTRMTRVTTTCV